MLYQLLPHCHNGHCLPGYPAPITAHCCHNGHCLPGYPAPITAPRCHNGHCLPGGNPAPITAPRCHNGHCLTGGKPADGQASQSTSPARRASVQARGCLDHGGPHLRAKLSPGSVAREAQKRPEGDGGYRGQGEPRPVQMHHQKQGEVHLLAYVDAVLIAAQQIASSQKKAGTRLPSRALEDTNANPGARPCTCVHTRGHA